VVSHSFRKKSGKNGKPCRRFAASSSFSFHPLPQGLKPYSILLLFGTTEQAAEKGCFSGKMPEKHASGAKARVDSIGLMPGINPRPTARQEFFRSL
jgi:hypothetical protein